MGYEAREDARNEYDAEIRRDALDAGNFDEYVADAIESGNFDTEVLERAMEIMDNFCVGGLDIRSELKQVRDMIGQNSAPSANEEKKT